MTDNHTPPPSDEEPLVHVGWWCWRGDNHGHLATEPCRSDNVPIHVPAEWADEMRAVIQRIEDGDDEEPTEAPPADATHGLSVQHADALWDAVAIPGPTEPTFPMQHERVCRAVAEILAEVTAAPGRADGLREAAELAAQDAEAESLRGHRYKAKREIAHKLRRLAAEAQQPEAPWATDSARIGRVLIWSHAQVGRSDFGQGYRTAQEDVRAILTRPLFDPAAEAQQQAETEPHPPHGSWLVEWSADGDEWAVAYPTHDHSKALERLARGRQETPEWQWRLVRETTTYTVEQPAAADTGEEAQARPVCEGFRWIGQSFATCDRCGQPAWDHVGEEVPVEGAGPFDTRSTVRPWKPGEADRIRAKWSPSTEQSTP